MSSTLRVYIYIVEHIEIVDEMPYRMMMPYFKRKKRKCFGNIYRLWRLENS